MLIWRITAIISAVVAVGLIVFLIIRGYRKNNYLHEYEEDECFKNTKDGGAKNLIYSTHGQTMNYIRRYALRKSVYDKSVICNYNDNYREISFFVMCYNKEHKVVDVILVKDNNVGNSSRIVNVNPKTYDVNIVIHSVDKAIINKNVIKEIPVTPIRLFSMCSAIAVFAGGFAVRELLIEIVAQASARLYLKSIWNWIGIGIILLIAVLYYCISAARMRRINRKNKNGGSLEYEFF